jgi:trk system potassium uptake protein TrkA
MTVSMQRFAVIGLGRFGQYLARALTEAGAEVIGIDRSTRAVEQARDDVAVAVKMNATDRTALAAQAVGEVDAAIVGIGEDFESAVLTVATLQEMGVPQIIARAMTEIQGQILRKVGAHAIASAERESATRWAHRLTLPRLERYVELGEDHSLVYIPAPMAFCHNTLLQLDLRKKHGVNLVGLCRSVQVKTDDGESTAKREIISVPRPDTTILPGDVLILVGANDSLSELPVD